MPPKKPKLRPDVNELAFKTAQAALGETEKPIPPEDRTEADKDPAAVERGRRGGRKGGKRRAKKLSAKRRKEIASQAAKARWSQSPE